MVDERSRDGRHQNGGAYRGEGSRCWCSRCPSGERFGPCLSSLLATRGMSSIRLSALMQHSPPRQPLARWRSLSAAGIPYLVGAS